MIRRSVRQARAGITLVEILISIMILGIGVISLATLFPIGMVRLRNAQRYTRSAFLFESAAADLGSRDLLNASSFLYNPWYYSTPSSSFYNPWVQDTPAFGSDWYSGGSPGAYRGFGATGTPTLIPSGAANPLTNFFLAGEGLPVAYDPLWRYLTNIYPVAGQPEARFASGIGLIRDDPAGTAKSSVPSAHGLQRVSNPPVSGSVSDLASFGRAILETFVSPEDLVLQEPTSGIYPDPNNATFPNLTAPSTIVPDLNMSRLNGSGSVVPSPTLDYRFTWFFTGRQTDAQNGAVFDGDIVICENRQFGMDSLPSPQTGALIPVPAGETVVEAVWGFATTADPSAPIYGSKSALRTVLLRWPASVPDPDVRVGGWIADVTYERNQLVANNATKTGRFDALYPGQRCHWYQVTKKTDVVDDPGLGGKNLIPYRRRTVWVSTPLKARTRLDFTVNGPVTPEAALIMPSVVNVVPRTVYTR